jgi:hypothetical protein
MKDLIDKLLALNVNEHTEKKANLTYLSWSWAWQQALKHNPEATYTIAKNPEGVPVFGNAKMGYMCYTTVTMGTITHEMWLPVMDMRNKTMLEPSMFDINKTVMRCLTKNLAMFGLGLYIYAGEDLPDGEEPPKTQPKQTKPTPTPELKPEPPQVITPNQAADLVSLCSQKGYSLAKIIKLCQVTELKDITTDLFAKAVKNLEKLADVEQ